MAHSESNQEAGQSAQVISLDSLMRRTEVTEEQLDRGCCELDLSYISEHILEYRKFGPKLGIIEAEFIEIEKNPLFFTSQMLKSEAVLKKWRAKNPGAATFRVLVEVALEMEDGVGAEEICKICAKDTETTSSISTSLKKVLPVLPSIVLLFAVIGILSHTTLSDTLKEKYQKLEKIDFEQYLPKSMSSRKLSFIPPNFKIADGFQKDELLSVNQLLESVENGSRLAVIGRPGAGKSTFARHVARLWASDSALENFDMLFHICLGGSNITNIQGLLEAECHDTMNDLEEMGDVNIIRTVVQQLKISRGREVVFILDEFNEYSFTGKNDFVLKLIKGKRFPESAIVVTSRPRGVEDFRRQFKMKVEIAEFSQHDIESALLPLDPPLRAVITKFLHSNPNVKKLCGLPLHMTMIIYLASVEEDALSSIDCETKIYKDFLYLTNKHYSEQNRQNEIPLDSCIKDQDTNSSCRLFSTVCELAFNGTVGRNQNLDILNTSVPFDIPMLSLYYDEIQKRRRGSVNVVAFSHPTFQEFLAAFHLAHFLPSEQQIEMIWRYGKHPVLQDLVWKFFFGLVGELNEEQALKSLFKTYVSFTSPCRKLPSDYYTINLYPIVYALETGRKGDKFMELLNDARVVGPGNNYSLHIVIQEPMDVKSFLDIGESATTNFQVMKDTLKWTLVKQLRIEFQANFTSFIPEVAVFCSNKWLQSRISVNRALWSIYRSYCNRTDADTVNTSTVVLELEYFQEQRDIIDPRLLFNFLKTSILPLEFLESQILRNSCNQLQKEEEDSFIELLIDIGTHANRSRKTVIPHPNHNFSKLRKFRLQQMLIDKDIEQLYPALKTAKDLEVLDLSHNRLAKPRHLVKLFKSFRHLQILDLSDNYWLDIDFIASGFKHLKHLVELKLSGSNARRGILTESSTERSFDQQLVYLKKLRNLDLSQILYGDFEPLALGLTHLQNLRSLNLSSCFVGTGTDLNKLVQSFDSLENLENLDLSYNVISYLSPEALRVLSTVRELNLSHNMLYPTPLIYLVPMLYSSKLRVLDLSNNFLCGDRGDFITFIMLAMRKLERLNLLNNMLFLELDMDESDLVNKWIYLEHDEYTYSGGSQFFSYAANSGLKVVDSITAIYAECICLGHSDAKCLGTFLLNIQSSLLNPSRTTFENLQAIRDELKFNWRNGYLRSVNKYQSFIHGQDRKHTDFFMNCGNVYLCENEEKNPSRDLGQCRKDGVLVISC